MTLAKNIFLFLLIFVLIFNISCSNKECEKSLDCDQKECFTTSCSDGQCNYNPKLNCCGNDMEEDIEDGKPGNECTCSADYGSCTGTKGDYLKKHCNEDDECVFGVSDDKIRSIRLSEDKSPTGFDLTILSEYDAPFVLGVSNFILSFEVTDLDEDLKPPMIITKIRVFDDDFLLAVYEDDIGLMRVGDKKVVSIDFDFDMNKIEEEKDIEIKIDYEYNKPKRVRGDDGEYSYEDEIYRKDFSISYRDELIFVNPSMVK